MKTFRKFGMVALIAAMALAVTSCAALKSLFAEYPDDGLEMEDRATITLTLDLNGGTTTTPLESGKYLVGKYNGLIHLNTPQKEGYEFTGWSPAMPRRYPAYDATFTATFNRPKEYYIKYELGGGVNSGSNPMSYNIESQTITLQNAAREGYSFGGWYKDYSYRTPFSQIPSGSIGNVIVYAKWIPGQSAYRIEHWLQNANDNNYTISANDTQTKIALSDSITEATAKSFSGFVPLNIVQQKVAGDGSTVVKVLYNRTLVQFTFNLNGGTGATTLSGKFGETVIAPSVPTREGYAFDGWRPSLPATFISNGTYTATWKVSSDPTYKVEHWQQNANGQGYSLFATTTETKISSTGGNAGTAVKNYPGFTVKSIDQAKAENGDAVVRIYYDRNSITLTFDLDGGNGTTTLNGKFGATTSGIAKPTKSGYTFAGWSPTLPSTFPSENTTYKATWSKAAAAYKVEHWQQNANNDNYSLAQTENKTGSVGSQSAAEAKTFSGFTAQPFAQMAIQANGSTLVKIYYNRKNVELTLELNGGTGTTKLSGLYGATLTPPPAPTKSSNVFKGWEPALPAVFPDVNTTYYANWELENVEEDLKVEIYKEDFYSTKYSIDRVRDVHRSPALPSSSDTELRVFMPQNPMVPFEGKRLSNSEVDSFKYIMLKKAATKDQFDEYGVTKDGQEILLAKNGVVMCLGDEGFLYLAGRGGKALNTERSSLRTLALKNFKPAMEI